MEFNFSLLHRTTLLICIASLFSFGGDPTATKLTRLVNQLHHLDKGPNVVASAQVQYPDDDPDYLANKEANTNWCAAPNLMDVVTAARVAGHKMMTCELIVEECDNANTRDNTPLAPIEINVVFHVIRGNGGGWGVNQATVDATVSSMNDYFQGTGIEFRLADTQFHTDNELSCIEETSLTEDLQTMKNRYATNPAEQLNIYVSCSIPAQANSYIAGSATIPQMVNYGWDDPLSNLGGLWLRDTVVGANSQTAAHEIGHCLGLWHTHVAVSDFEYPCNHECAEFASGVQGNTRGDLCADTPATPINFPNPSCESAAGSDCQNTPWGDTMPENMMGYASGCSGYIFTEQQARRMQCYARGMLSGWLHETDDETLDNDVTENYVAAEGALLHYTVTLPNDVSEFDVDITGSGDADLYVKRTPINWPADEGKHDLAEFKSPYIGGSAESVSFTNPAAGIWHVYIHGYDPANGTVTASWQISEDDPQWFTSALSENSPHPYGHDQVYQFNYAHAGAERVAVHFNELDTESGYDFVEVYDSGGNLVYRVSGDLIANGSGSAFSRTDGWCIVNGSSMTVRLVTDYSVNDYGYAVDGAAYYQ